MLSVEPLQPRSMFTLVYKTRHHPIVIMKIASKFIAILLVVAAYLLASCGKKDEPVKQNPLGLCDLMTITYSSTVQQILVKNCATGSCHSSITAFGGVDLETFAGVQAVARDGRLEGSIRQLSGFEAMPRAGLKLDSCSITKVGIWIKEGALNN